MAFGGGGPVFLGDDMMQGREYSEEVANLIDSETQRVLVDQEARCKDLLSTHRKALNLVARGLLEHETLSGDEVRRLINVAGGNETVAAAPAPKKSSRCSSSGCPVIRAAARSPASTTAAVP